MVDFCTEVEGLIAQRPLLFLALTGSLKTLVERLTYNVSMAVSTIMSLVSKVTIGSMQVLCE